MNRRNHDGVVVAADTVLQQMTVQRFMMRTQMVMVMVMVQDAITSIYDHDKVHDSHYGTKPIKHHLQYTIIAI